MPRRGGAGRPGGAAGGGGGGRGGAARGGRGGAGPPPAAGGIERRGPAPNGKRLPFQRLFGMPSLLSGWLWPCAPIGTSIPFRGAVPAQAESCRGPGEPGEFIPEAVTVVAQHDGTPPPAPVLLSGIIPPLADPYFRRTETATELSAGPVPGQTVVLTHGEETAAAPAAQGGTGKTQLAAGFARALRAAQAVAVLVWVTATGRDAVVTGFAQAAEAVGAADPGTAAEAAAERFAAWLAHTTRPWALIIDDLADPADR